MAERSTRGRDQADWQSPRPVTWSKLQTPSHIGLVMPGFHPDEHRDGIPILRDLVRQLSSRYLVSVFALRFPPERSIHHAFNAQVYCFGGAGRQGLSRLPFLARSVFDVCLYARQQRIDLLHGFWADEPGFVASFCGRLLKLPSVISFMGGELVGIQEIDYGGQLSRLNPALTRVGSFLADALTAGSQTMIERYAGGDKGPLPIHLPLGVDTTFFSPQADVEEPTILSGGKKILSVASLSPVKDHLTLLRAFALVAGKCPDVHLHLVGDGSLRGELERRVISLGLEGMVIFHGHVPRRRLATYYRQTDIFVLSSRFESQALVLLEAGACGCSIVGTRVGLIPELTTNVIDVPVGDAEALANALLRLIADSDLRRRLGTEILARVRDQYTLSGTVQQLAGLYGQLLTEKKPVGWLGSPMGGSS